jgi:signal transduction histidine kinase/DNA-binding response OmpR family regulator
MERPCILVVDDEIIIARDLEARLQSMDFEVVAIASTGAEAIDLAAEYLPDLILMDIVLKGNMDGIEAAAEIRKRFHCPVIYVTAYTDDRTLQRAKVTEPFGYIVKPFLGREIKANIEMALYKHRMENKLRNIERWFSQALEGNDEGIILADRDHRISVLNPVGETITAWPRELAAGRPLGEVLQLKHHGNPVNFDHVKEGPIICLSDDTVLVDRAGEPVPVDSMISGVRDDGDELTGTISVIRDASGNRQGTLMSLVTDVSLAVAETTTLRGMLQLCAESIVRNLNGAFCRIWTVNKHEDMLELEASAGTYTNLDGDHARIPVGEFKIGMIAANRQAHMTNDVQNDPMITDHDWARRERMVAFAGYPLLVDDQLLGVVGMFSRRYLGPAVLDALAAIAQTISVGIQRKRVEDQLRQSQKMEALGLLASGVAHDFNNLLTVITGYSEMLMEDGSVEVGSRQFLSEIHAAGRRAAALTGQLLAFSRKQVVSPVSLDLNAIVAGMEKFLRRIIGEDVSLAVAANPNVDPILADPSQVEQILANLAVNARDAMPKGGRLTIETKNVELNESYSRRRGEVNPGAYIQLAVSDTGDGIPPEIVPHVFEPFFTTKAVGYGTGLGLSTVYGIVKQAGGHVEIYSELGIGTTVKVYFPSSSAAIVSPETDTLVKRSQAHETVLVLEDEASVRTLIVRCLRTSGYNVIEATSGAEALDLAMNHPEPIHLLLTDVVMPQMSGSEVAEKWHAIRPETKLLYMSGYTDDAVVRHGVLQAAMEFLQKPFTPARLAEKVREVLDKEPPDQT